MKRREFVGALGNAADAMLHALASHGYIPDRDMALEIRAS
jgi:hypothetical protein